MNKFGILYCAYGDIENARRSIQPLIQFRKNNNNVLIAAVSVPFNKFYDENNISSDDETVNLLQETLSNNQIDALFSEPKFISEAEARTMPLDFLVKNGCDWVFIVDGDEMYTTDSLERLMEFSKTATETCYRTYFYTMIGNKNTFRDDNSNRLFSTTQHGGIIKFIHDNDVAYADGYHTASKTFTIIPKSVIFAKHYSWISPKRMLSKSRYQMKRWGFCSFVESDNKLRYIDSPDKLIHIPSISIVIPTYKNPKCLDILLKSLIDDSIVEHEINVVVDGTQSENEHIIEKYKDRVNFLILRNNVGMCAAQNIGVSNSKLNTVLILNDDYVAHPLWDEDILQYYNHNNVVIFNTIESHGPSPKYFIVHDFGKTVDMFNRQEFREFESNVKFDPVDEGYAVLPFMMNKYKYLALGGWDVQYPNGMVADCDFFLKCKIMGMKFKYYFKHPFYHFGSCTMNNEFLRANGIMDRTTSYNVGMAHATKKWGTTIKLHNHKRYLYSFNDIDENKRIFS